MKAKPGLRPTPIIIVNWNGLADTLQCVESVLAMAIQDFIIHLVDNGSDHDEGIRLRDRYDGHPKIRVHLNPTNLGFAAANQRIVKGILDAKHLPAYVALLNNDTVVDKNWLKALITAAKDHQAQVVSSKLMQFQHRDLLDNAGHQMLNTGEIIPIGHGQPIDHFDHSFSNLGACAGAALYDLEMIKQIGFFDAYFSTGYEDAEFGLRAWLAGYKCIYSPSAMVYHKLGASIKKIFDKEYALMIQNAIWYTYFKLMPTKVILISLPFILVKQFILIIINLLFFKWHHIEIQFRSWWRTILNWRSKIIPARKMSTKYRQKTTWAIISHQTFFLWHDIRRFVAIYLKGKPSSVEQYGD